jgi:hypothetical protein
MQNEKYWRWFNSNRSSQKSSICDQRFWNTLKDRPRLHTLKMLVTDQRPLAGPNLMQSTPNLYIFIYFHVSHAECEQIITR